ncbi:hypothetical protein [Lachnospira eligens]|uniref:hypothetical protein n=1 Tax=Lachnospira eligens TaxID=39485 RepID=UPI002E8DCF2D|nr:hypothetical protein [Lachnospira eligens]
MPTLSNTSVSIERMPSFAIPGSVIITGHDFFFLLSTDGMSDNALTILGFLYGRNGSAILNTV